MSLDNRQGSVSNEDVPLIIKADTVGAIDGLKTAVEQCMSDQLLQAGFCLFRGYELGEQDFESFIQSVTPSLLEYDYASTPRSRVKGQVYTSTEYPPSIKIPMHNEMAYTTSWPKLLWFYCDIAAQSGGQTPLADSREVYRRIDPVVRQRFEELGVLYTRTYNNGLDVPWQQVFGSDDRAVVEEYCRRSGIEFQWLEDDMLKTRQVCQASTRHPQTGETVWFNQAHLFHVSALPEDVRENLLLVVEEEDLPRNAYYGDGSPIEDQVLHDIRAIYDEIAVAFDWQSKDLLLIDNLLAAHGRYSFTGDRRVLVAMA